MKRFYRKPWFWILTAAVVSIGAAAGILAILNPAHVAETAPEHADANLRTRRYRYDGDLEAASRTVAGAVLEMTTYGSSWKWAFSDLSKENVAVVHAEVPVVFFTDDLQIKISKEANEIVVNARSESRTGDSDLGENRRHLLQILEKLDERFGQNTN